MGVNRGTLAWATNLALSRASEIAAVRPLLNAFFFSKYLHWRALGMKIDYGVNTSIGVSFVDLPMITIRKGSTVAEGVHIACHTFVGDRLVVFPVEIGENVFVGMNCTIGPKTKIGNGAWIGMHNVIGGDLIPEGTKIESYAWEHGNPKARAREKASSIAAE
jgi:acetyltransferase-like isoleucine patch superfamily enzyme